MANMTIAVSVSSSWKPAAQEKPKPDYALCGYLMTKTHHTESNLVPISRGTVIHWLLIIFITFCISLCCLLDF